MEKLSDGSKLMRKIDIASLHLKVLLIGTIRFAHIVV